ncbi:MAG: YraN family protein [Myxococcota bacterium]|nr:YraN family protein [Myxococcota bacterium]
MQEKEVGLSLSSTKIGKNFEAQAARELRRLGWSILNQNYHTPYGEIDIVSIKEGRLWFVEVKGTTKRRMDYGRVDAKKRRRIRLSVSHWLSVEEHSYEELELVVCFATRAGLDWITNAFDGE